MKIFRSKDSKIILASLFLMAAGINFLIMLVLYINSLDANAEADEIVAMTFFGGLACLGLGVARFFPLWGKIRQEKWARQYGVLVQADMVEIKTDGGTVVNDTSPYYLIAQWKDSQRNKVFVFKSRNIWFNPQPYIDSKTIPVYIDPANPVKYHVDVTSVHMNRRKIKQLRYVDSSKG